MATYEMHDTNARRWAADRLPTPDEINALLFDGLRITLYRDGIPLGIYDAIAGLVTICAWCADGSEKTKQARANGCDVTHTICETCKAFYWEAE